MTSTWFTADLHLGHAMVAGLRGFEDYESEAGTIEAEVQHDARLYANWNKVVSKRDTVYVLGDLTLQNPKRWVGFVNALAGRKHFISGNHDPVWPGHRDWHKWLPTYLEMFESVTPFARRRINNTDVLLSHFPYSADHHDGVRFDQFRLKDLGGWLLHGHTHSAEFWTGRKEIHVGLDAWGLAPVPIEEIENMMRESELADTGGYG